MHIPFKFLAHFPGDHLAHPVVSSPVHFLCQFAAFAYYVIDRFVSVSTEPSFAILLSLIYFGFDMIGSYGVVLCYYMRDSVSLLEFFTSALTDGFTLEFE